MASITESDWLNERHRSQWMVLALSDIARATRTKVGRRKLRLFACGCCRLVWSQLEDARLREAVELAERFAEGHATKDELAAMRRSVQGLAEGNYTEDNSEVRSRTAASMAIETTNPSPHSAAFTMTAYPFPLAGVEDGSSILCDLLRCVFGNPFQSVSVDPPWLAWNDGTLRRIAQGIYDERALDRLPILADAMEDAGCENADILAHCRDGKKHPRGCWVVDLLLGKQ